MMISVAITLGISTAIALICGKGIIDYRTDDRPREGLKQVPEKKN